MAAKHLRVTPQRAQSQQKWPHLQHATRHSNPQLCLLYKNSEPWAERRKIQLSATENVGLPSRWSSHVSPKHNPDKFSKECLFCRRKVCSFKRAAERKENLYHLSPGISRKECKTCSLWEACRGFQQLQLFFPEHSQTNSSKENKKVPVTPIPVSKRGQNEQGVKTDVIQNRSQTNY